LVKTLQKYLFELSKCTFAKSLKIKKKKLKKKRKEERRKKKKLF
jgi:hypothetical protein